MHQRAGLNRDRLRHLGMGMTESGYGQTGEEVKIALPARVP